MSNERAPKKFYISPLGKAGRYCWITKPDTGTGEFKKKPTYIVNLVVGEAEGRKLFEFVEKAHDANFEAAKKDPKLNAKGKKVIEASLPCYFDDELESYVFSFRMNAAYMDKKSGEEKPLVLRCVDSQGERMPKVPQIGTGSELKVRFSLQPFAAAGGIGAGIRLQMDSLMLVKLVEFGAGGMTGKDQNWADEMEEGGFTSDEAEFNKEQDYESEEEETEAPAGGDF